MCFRAPSAPQNICGEGQRSLFLSLICHRHTPGLYLNQPDDSTYVLLEDVRMPPCCVSQCSPSVSVLTLLETGNQQFSDSSCPGDQAWSSSASEAWLSPCGSSAYHVASALGTTCSPSLCTRPTFHPKPEMGNSFILCRHGPLDLRSFPHKD